MVRETFSGYKSWAKMKPGFVWIFLPKFSYGLTKMSLGGARLLCNRLNHRSSCSTIKNLFLGQNAIKVNFFTPSAPINKT